MPHRKNNPNNQYVAKPGNKSRIVVETPGVRDETEDRELADVNRGAEIIRRGGAYSDKIKREPFSQLNDPMMKT